MGRMKDGAKGIFCVESLWNSRLVGDRQSVRPLLEVLNITRDTKFVHLTCNTIGELEFNLKSLRRHRRFGILYLAFHGTNGAIHLADGSKLRVDELGEMVGETLDGWVAHFASCSTLGASDDLRTFLKSTGAAVATGYTKPVDWIDGAAMDLLVLDWAQEYTYSRPYLERLTTTYSGLAGSTGFTGVERT
jgi:hypothetical protein